MVKKKRQSKRETLKDKYKKQRKVREHHRKARRERKRAVAEGRIRPEQMRRGGQREQGLPNLMPFKEQFLRDLLEQRQKEKEREKLRLARLNAERQANAAKRLREDGDSDEELFDADGNEIGRLRKRQRAHGPSADDLASAAARAEAYEARTAAENGDDDQEDGQGFASAQTRSKKRAYMKELRKVVDMADVVLLVLDARDPLGSRAPQAEKMVMENARDKRLVIVLNKIDLVPKEVVERWLTELRKEFPTIAFRASTQEQKSNLSRAAKDSIGLGTASTYTGNATVGDSICVGADTLLQLIKNYSRKNEIKTSITVGVVGYPNVGKSSVINSLKRSRAVGVSATAGFTKSLQTVQLDKKVKLIDSPGVLFRDGHAEKQSSQLALRNCVDPGDLDDAVAVVEQLLENCDQERLMFIYRIPRFSSTTEFLVSVAKKRGKLTKNGVHDLDAAARIVLHDLNTGKIPYYVRPPDQDDEKMNKGLLRSETTVVSEWAKEFDLDSLLAKEQTELVKTFPSSDPNDYAAVLESVVLN